MRPSCDDVYSAITVNAEKKPIVVGLYTGDGHCYSVLQPPQGLSREEINATVEAAIKEVGNAEDHDKILAVLSTKGFAEIDYITVDAEEYLEEEAVAPR